MKPASVTIIVPTRKRSALLRHCLQSIEMQSRADLISMVIVSENSDDPGSFEVAKSFSERLPIRYVRRQPELPVEQHSLALVRESVSEFTALIADDDMWGRYHLEEASRAFALNESIHAFFGQAIVVVNQSCYPLRRFTGSLLQVLPSDISSVPDFFVWSPRDTAMHCMSHTPLNIWSLVARTSTLAKAMELAADAPQPSTDKMLIWKLSTLGLIAVSREITLFYRMHPGSMIVNMLAEDGQAAFEADFRLTRTIEEEAREYGCDPVDDWRAAFQAATDQMIGEHIQTWTPLVYRYLIKGENPIDVVPSSGPRPRSVRERLQNILYLLTPPLLSWSKNRLNAFLRSGH